MTHKTGRIKLERNRENIERNLPKRKRMNKDGIEESK
jgi:hypothetical protein